ncbi:hypothetical protein NDU88_001221 [Pleurodeles waltl]|uniref:Uncharacterized protein n=1 Tax=Pleurodeles waltl TaxID=8319 RepID=A0AAV7P329_PLEWA|nr:hypothetical protein NDU88_001221 [Pleurodeles waltl]
MTLFETLQSSGGFFPCVCECDGGASSVVILAALRGTSFNSGRRGATAQLCRLTSNSCQCAERSAQPAAPRRPPSPPFQQRHPEIRESNPASTLWTPVPTSLTGEVNPCTREAGQWTPCLPRRSSRTPCPPHQGDNFSGSQRRLSTTGPGSVSDAEHCGRTLGSK